MLLAGLLAAGRLRPETTGTKPPGTNRGGQALLITVGTGLVLCGVILGQALAGRHISTNNAALALALTPAVLAVLRSVSTNVPRVDLTGQLWPGLAGLMGLLLLLPQPSFSGVRAWTGLTSIPLLTGLGAALFAAEPDGGGRTGNRQEQIWLFAGCLVAAVTFGCTGFLRQEPFTHGWTWHATCLDALIFWLSLVALGRLGCSRWSAQFLFIPLLGFGEGLIFVRPLLDFRSWVGLALLGAGAVRQLFPEEQEADTSSFLRVPSA